MDRKETLRREKQFSFRGRTSCEAYRVVLFHYILVASLAAIFNIGFLMVCGIVNEYVLVEGLGFNASFIVTPLVALYCAIRVLPVLVRRLHDLGITGWLLLLALPLLRFIRGNVLIILFLIIIGFIKGQNKHNKYG